MKTKKSILHALACAVFLFGMTTMTTFAQMPALQWNKSYGGNTCSTPFTNDNYDAAGGVAQAPDGGFIAVSSINSRNGDFHGNHATTSLSSDVGVVRTNASGDTIYTKMHGGTGYDDGRSVIVTKDGNFFYNAVTSSSNGDVSGTNGSYDIWAVKGNLSTGAIIWQIPLGGAQAESIPAAGTSVAQLSDSTYIVCGATSSTGLTGHHGGQDGYVAHLSKTGTLLNQLCIGGSSTDGFNSVVATSDGGYILVGYTTSTNGDVTGYLGGGDMFVAKMTSLDVISWTKCLGTSGYQEFGWTIQQDYDGGYLVGGNTKGGVAGYKGGLHDGLVFKITSTGSVVRTTPYGGSKDDNIYSLALTPDSGFVFAAITNSNDSNVAGGNYHPTSNDSWAGKVNKNGILTSQKCYGGNGPEVATCIIVSSDGGYVVFGHTNSSANGDVTSVGHTVTINGTVRATTELWLFKLYTPPGPIAPPGPRAEPRQPAIARFGSGSADENISETGAVQHLKVYDNQASLVVEKPSNTVETSIFDLQGKLIYSSKENEVNINFLKGSNAIYIAKIFTDDGNVETFKFFVQ